MPSIAHQLGCCLKTVLEADSEAPLHMLSLQFKAVDEAQPRRASNLARFVATVIANFGLSLSILKVRVAVATPVVDKHDLGACTHPSLLLMPC